MKYFIITVDTEGDNLWGWKDGDKITTRNAKHIPRFQELCEHYQFKPTYLVNYEMSLDSEWVKYSRLKANRNLCEIGMHIHAWNTPPIVRLENKYNGNPYISEYPDDIINKKIKYLCDRLRKVYGMDISSGRSGRWAINKSYIEAIKKNGILVDCSVVPGIDLSKIPGRSLNCGNNYRKVNGHPNLLVNGILEVPMSSRRIRHIGYGSLKHRTRNLLLGENMWLRPIKKSIYDLKYLSNYIENEGMNYLEFMIHSSELMMKGSPYFKDESEIEQLYEIMEKYFLFLKEKGYVGISLSDYAHKWFDANR